MYGHPQHMHRFDQTENNTNKQHKQTNNWQQTDRYEQKMCVVLGTGFLLGTPEN
jgi:hypothetical protein